MTVLGLYDGNVGLGSYVQTCRRFTAGMIGRYSRGFGFVTLAMAMFDSAEAIFLVLKPKERCATAVAKLKICALPRKRLAAIAPVIGVGKPIQGFFIGVLPGAGATIARLGLRVETLISRQNTSGRIWQRVPSKVLLTETGNTGRRVRIVRLPLLRWLSRVGTTAFYWVRLDRADVTPGGSL